MKQGLVAGAGKTVIRDVAYQQYFGEFALDHVGGAIRGSVIHHDSLDPHALGPIVQRLQTGAQHRLAIPVGDAHRYVDRGIFEETSAPGSMTAPAPPAHDSLIPCGYLLRRGGSQIAGRRTDDLQHFGCCGLLLEGFLEIARLGLYLVEQANIFDSDHSLVGKSGNQGYLLFSKKLNALAREYNDAN